VRSAPKYIVVSRRSLPGTKLPLLICIEEICRRLMRIRASPIKLSGLPDASEEFATAPPMIDGRVAAALDCAAPAAASDSAASDSAATPTTVASARVVEHLIILDFEGTCDPSDERLTRLQQCDIHEIIEFPAVWISARGENAGTEIDFFREYVKPVEGAAEGKAREISAFCECRSRATHALGTLNSELCHVLTTVPRALAPTCMGA